jgi:hypothetical protein
LPIPFHTLIVCDSIRDNGIETSTPRIITAKMFIFIHIRLLDYRRTHPGADDIQSECQG